MISYDLHIHSCLSPCGDDDMTVNNIAGMAKIKNLRAIALCDHNTCMNLRAFEKACEFYGIVSVPGIEVTTAEEIHILLYFRTVEDGEAFEKILDGYRAKIKNKKEIFGNQIITDENDTVLGEYEYLLPVATGLSVDEVYAEASKFDCAVVPAHIDKTSNGMIAILGTMPETPVFSCVEIKNPEKAEEIKKANPVISQATVITDSDAHLLWDINEAENFLPLSAHGDTVTVRNRIIDYLRGIK